MKNNKLCMLAAGLLTALTACQTTEILDQRQDNRITLRTSVNTATKAVPLSTDFLKFQGFHLAVFEGPILDSGSAKYFEMDMGTEQFMEDGYYAPYFWGEKPLHFYAWYPKSEAGAMVVDQENRYSISYTPATNAAQQKDFSVAYNTGTKEDNGSTGVNMNFRHALAQVQIVVKNGSTLADNNVIVKAVKVGNAIKSGTLGMPFYPTSAAVTEDNLLTSLWRNNVRTATGDKNIQTYSIYHESPITIARGDESSVMGPGGNWMLIPQVSTAETHWEPELDGGAGDKMYMALLVKLMQGSAVVYPSSTTPDEDKEDNYGWTAVPIPAGSSLEAGKKYTFTLTFIINTGNAGNRISDGKEILSHPIKLSVSVDDWIEVANGEDLY